MGKLTDGEKKDKGGRGQEREEITGKYRGE